MIPFSSTKSHLKLSSVILSPFWPKGYAFTAPKQVVSRKYPFVATGILWPSFDNWDNLPWQKLPLSRHARFVLMFVKLKCFLKTGQQTDHRRFFLLDLLGIEKKFYSSSQRPNGSGKKRHTSDVTLLCVGARWGGFFRMSAWLDFGVGVRSVCSVSYIRIGYVTLAAITGTIVLVPYILVKSLQLILRSGTRRWKFWYMDISQTIVYSCYSLDLE